MKVIWVDLTAMAWTGGQDLNKMEKFHFLEISKWQKNTRDINWVKLFRETGQNALFVQIQESFVNAETLISRQSDEKTLQIQEIYKIRNFYATCFHLIREIRRMNLVN